MASILASRRPQTVGVALCLAVTALGCSDSGTDPEQGPLVTAEEVTYAPELGVDLNAMNRLPQGVYWQDIETHPDSTIVQLFQVMFVRYSGWLNDGTRFADDLPFNFLLGGGEAISGWDLGLIGMRKGGIRRLVVPPANAYGHFDTGAIPGNTVTVFEIQLDSIRVPL